MAQEAQYVLQENLLTSDPDDYNGRIVNARSYTQADIVGAVAEGTAFSVPDLSAAIDLYNERVAKIIAEGGNVNTPLINTSLSIAGVFHGADDAFDARRHAVKLNISAGARLREAVRQVRLEKVRAAETTPWIQSVADKLADDAAANFEVAAGSVIQLKGARLKYDDADASQGVFLLPAGAEGGAVRCGRAVMNKPATVIVQVPADVAAGEYELEVRTSYTGNKTAGKTLKKGRFLRTITVIG